MKGLLYIGLAFIGLVVVVWAWPLITAVVLGGGAGLLGAILVLFVAFLSWYVCNGLFGKSRWEEINDTTMGLWGCLYLLLGFVGGIYAYIHATGNFFAKYVPLMAGSAALLGVFPAWIDRTRAKGSDQTRTQTRSARRTSRSQNGNVGLTRDGRIVQHGEESMADLDIDLDISAPVSNRG